MSPCRLNIAVFLVSWPGFRFAGRFSTIRRPFPPVMDANKPQPSAEVHPDPIILDQEQIRESDDENQQDGVRVAEAVTKTWSKTYLVIAYVR